MFPRIGVALVAVTLAGCGSSSTPADRSPGPPVSSTAPAAAAGRPVTFAAADGVRLTGTLYGTGRTAVVLSNMGDNDPSYWQGFAPTLAERGYLVLSYSFRYPANPSSFSSDDARHTADDLLGAVAKVRATGATAVVLAGGSLGGMATAKVATRAKAAAIVVVSAPVDLDDYGFHVLPAELQSSMPKLFIGSVDDRVVPFAETRRMFDLAAQPKQLQSYDATEHALHLFQTEHAKALSDRLVGFLTAEAPATP